MVDCSHANSSKQHEKQIDVAKDIAAQLASGSHSVFGVMVESNLQAGAQKFTPGKDKVCRSGHMAKASPMLALTGMTRLMCWKSLSQGVLARRKLGSK